MVDAAGPTDVPAGDSVQIVCVPVAGTPAPDLEFKGTDGAPLPPGATVVEGTDLITLTVPNVMEKFCVDCVGSSLEGDFTDTHCVDVLGM